MKLANTTTTMKTKEITNLKARIEAKEVSKGAAIREMFADGFSVKEISDSLEIRYNHCYNVIQNEVLTKGLEIEKSERAKGNTNKKEILELLQSGKTVREVAEITKTIYNTVWLIAKQNGLTKKQKATATEESA